ncbi:MAG: hypothetical protein DMD35_22325 [Gemmatimonadetes bacterium]|nr:MAG: hypothetical protein DMD35_22325 [Gemmatimonadota bacterium]
MTRHALRCGCASPLSGKLSVNRTAASRATSPETLSQTYRKWSAVPHMLAPPPVTSYERERVSKRAAPAPTTDGRPTLVVPWKSPSEGVGSRRAAVGRRGGAGCCALATPNVAANRSPPMARVHVRAARRGEETVDIAANR